MHRVKCVFFCHFFGRHPELHQKYCNLAIKNRLKQIPWSIKCKISHQNLRLNWLRGKICSNALQSCPVSTFHPQRVLRERERRVSPWLEREKREDPIRPWRPGRQRTGNRNRSGAEPYRAFEPPGVDHLRPVTARPAYRERPWETVRKRSKT